MIPLVVKMLIIVSAGVYLMQGAYAAETHMTVPQAQQPLPYEVFQRESNKASVPCRISGVAISQMRVAVLDKAGKVVRSRKLKSKNGAVSGTFEVPSGGWYWLAIEVDGSYQRLVPFGVGDIYVVAGQSNAAGTGNVFLPDRSGLVSVQTPEGTWTLATKPDGMRLDIGSGSAWPVLGELLATTEKVPIGFIVVAVGATSTDMWMPTGTLYPALKRALVERRTKAVLWHQGESDANDSYTTEHTYNNMVTIIKQSRADAGWQVPWYVATATFLPWLTTDKMDPVRLAQKKIVSDGLAFAGPDTDTYVPVSMRHDTVHFGSVGLTVHAVLWFKALKLDAVPAK